MDIDQKFRGMKAEYESTLNMTESRSSHPSRHAQCQKARSSINPALHTIQFLRSLILKSNEAEQNFKKTQNVCNVETSHSFFWSILRLPHWGKTTEERSMRYRDAVNREKSKLDTITSENDQLRKIISSNDYRSPGIGTLTYGIEFVSTLC